MHTNRVTVRLLAGCLALLGSNEGGWAQIITTVAGNGECCFWGDGGPATQAGLTPQSVFVDADGDLHIADSRNQRVRHVDAGTGVITTVAGTGERAFSEDGGLATESALLEPSGVFVDGSGNIYIAEFARIRRVDGATGIITTVAGMPGEGSFSGDGGSATQAHLWVSSGVVIDAMGHFYIADAANKRIRRVDGVTGIITTVAGTGEGGFSGDGGPATEAELSRPEAVSLDAAGNLYIADAYNQRIRRVDATTGVITTVAGPEGLVRPESVFVDPAGSIYIADPDVSQVLRMDATGTLTAVAGTGDWGYSGDGGAATQAQLSYPSGVFVDAAGHVYVVDSGNRRIRRVDATTGIITTIAGGGLSDGVPATESSLNRPFNVFATPAQDLYIADTGNHRIRRVDGDTGIITTVAGSGDAGFSGDGGPATQAQLSGPLAVAVDTEGHVYLADSGNARVRRVDAASGIITTVAGSGDSLGDGGAATEARLFWPTDVCVDEAGHLYVADPENRRIRRVDASTGIITTVAGTSGRRGGEGVPATQAGLLFPKGLVVDAAGHLFIADSQSGRIRRVDAVSGIITTVAGNGALRSSGDGKPATEAGLQPEDVSVDKAGNLYIAEWYRIRRVDALTGVIETYAGTRQRGFSGDGGSATRARINRAFGIAVDGAGNLFIADSGNDRIRRVTLDLTHVADDMLPEQTASDFALHQNSPNPFNPSTHIAYQLAEDGPVSLTIYGLLGQRLRVLVQEPQRAGAYHVAWDGRDSSGRVVATGIYVYRLTSSQGVLARRMLRMK